MARIDPIHFSEWSADMKAATGALAPPSPRHARRSASNRPRAENALGTLAHHPVLAKAFFTLNGHLMMTTMLSERQRELVILRVAALRKATYEWAQHHFLAREIGLTDEEIARVAFGSDAPFWNPCDAALLRAVDELIDDGRIGAATWETLSSEMDVRQMLDVIFTVSGYDAFARMLLSCQVDLDDDLVRLRPI